MTEQELIQKIISIARAEVGYLEKASNKDLDHKTKNAGAKNYTRYGRDLQAISKNINFPAAWCCCWCSWVLVQAVGLQKAKELLYGDIDDYTVYAANRFKNNKAFHSSPKVGDLIFFQNSVRINHVGLVVNIDANRIYTIEGNTSSGNDVVIANGGCVSEKSYLKTNTRIAGYGRPKYSAACTQAPVITIPSQSCILEFIDISHHNTINLSQTATKYKDVIIRAGYRSSTSGKIELDKKFLEHTQAAIANSMKYGFYIFDQSINETEAIQEADFMADLIAPLMPTHPLFIDSEYANKNHTGRADNISKEQRTKNLVAYCKRLQERGFTPGIYASENWFQTMVDFNQLKQFPIWCARYSENKPRISEYDAWQYGSAYVPGSSSPIDVNRLYTNWNENLLVAETYFCKVIASILNVRNKPNKTGDDIGDLKNGTGINIYQMRNGWCKISENSERWCSYKYIKPTVGVVSNCNKLTCRQSPGKTGKAVFYLSAENQVNILRQDEVTQWYFIEHQGKTGYVSNKYITI